MTSLKKIGLPLVAAVLAIGLTPLTSFADNPITKPNWEMPRSDTPGNFGSVDCDPIYPDPDVHLPFGDCFSQNTLLLRLTGSADGVHPNKTFMSFVEDLVETKLLRSGGADFSSAEATFSTFLDLTLKRFLDDDTTTTIDYNPNTYAYRHVTASTGPYAGANSTIGLGGYEPAPLLDRTCIDIPLVGTVCLNGYLYDVDNEPGQIFFSYGYDNNPGPALKLKAQTNGDVETDHMTGALCDTGLAPPGQSPCGPTTNGELLAEQRDDDDGLEVRLQLTNVKLDLFFEPPTDTTLTNCANSATNCNGPSGPEPYAPENDLSTYLKAYGTAHLGTIDLVLNLRIAANYNDAIQPHSIAMGFELQDVAFNSDFQFVFKKGPYCTNNLGFTSHRLAGATNAPAALRPFNDAGVANYPNLVSDTNGTTAQQDYYVQQPGLGYPTGGGALSGVAGAYTGGGSGAGRDRIGVGTSPYEYNDADGRWSDNPNNCRFPADACTMSGGAEPDQSGSPEFVNTVAGCEYPNIANNSDDATYKISEQITSIIPYIQGEIKVTAEDKFKNRERGQPGYYLGPTSLLDLGSTLAGISFDWPLRAGTDYVFIDALLSSDVDNDSTNEFWADTWGVMMPFNFALGVSWNSVPGITAPVSKRLDLTSGVGGLNASCVQELGVVTGYRDGFGEFDGPNVRDVAQSGAQNKNDDPFLTRTTQPKSLQDNPSTASYKGVLSGYGFPRVTTNSSTAQPAAVVPTGADTGGDSYALGFGLHQNVLSAAIYDAVVKGLLCADLDSTGQVAPVDDQLGGQGIADLLNTSTFELFFPALYERYPKRPMRVRVIPLLDKYTPGSACPVDGFGDPDCPAEAGDPGWTGVDVGTVLSDLPSLQADADVPYVITGGPPIKLALVGSNATALAQPGIDPNSADLQWIWPDLTLVIPHLLVEFYVYGENDTDNNWYRVFALDLGVAVGLNIDIVKQPASYSSDQFVAPSTGPTYFPIGCNPAITDPNQVSYCSGGSAYTRRVLRLAGIADPELNAIIEYSELTFGQTGTQGTNAGGSNICDGLDAGLDAGCTTTRPVLNAFTDYKVLKGALSNLIGLATSVDINALVEIGFDLGAFLNVPIAIDAPYIGTSYVAAGGSYTTPGTNITDREYPSPNGFGDYLVGGVSLDLSALDSGYLIRQINYLLDGTSSTQPFGLEGLDIGLAPNGKPKFADYQPVPQAVIEAPVKISASETVFRFSGHDQADGNDLRYTWRVDNGVWTVFNESTEARIHGLLEGKHTFEVKAINNGNMMQDVPARYTFVVDSIAPKVRVVGDRTVGNRASFFVEANDWLTPKEDIRVAYKLDDGRWSNYGYNKKISLSGLREGRHTLRVRSTDNAGNTAESAFNFSASDGGFGCSTANGTGSLADVLVMLVIPALVLLRRRLR